MHCKISSTILLSVFLVIFLSVTPTGFCNDAQEMPYVPNEVLVRFHDGVAECQKELVRSSLNASLIKVIKSIKVEYWKLPKDRSTEEALEILKNNPLIEHAEPNYLSKPLTIPNDPQFNKLWFLQNTGQKVNGKTGTPRADINAAEAWKIETGSKEVVIAVIDSGVAFDHPDLKNNIWTNSGEISGNGIDDDDNGYIDDVHGWDFVNNDSNPSDYSKTFSSGGHGTHVAGTIAAEGNNGIGISGVMWEAQIMALQIFDIFDENPTNAYEYLIRLAVDSLKIISAVDYAVNNGAKIINCSFGKGLYSTFENDIFSLANDRGVLVIAAAGNDGLNNDSKPKYPASYDLPNIISVAASTERDTLATYSNYGKTSVHVAAPGGNDFTPNIYSTTPPEREDLFYDGFESVNDDWGTFGTYKKWSSWWVGLTFYQGYVDTPAPWTVDYDHRFRSKVAMVSTGNYQKSQNSYLVTKNPINIANCRGIHIQFNILYELAYNRDFLFVLLSLDGIDYVKSNVAFSGLSDGIDTYLEWAGKEFEVDQFYLGFQLQADAQTYYGGAAIDNILITGIPWVFTGNEYDYKSGTSMAAPVVSGVAGLIWSYDPELTHLQVKDIILNTVDTLPSLSGKVSSGGRVNAANALLSLIPPPKASAGSDQAVDGGDEVVLDGRGSEDPDNIDLYQWAQIDGPSITITDATKSVARFTAPEAGNDPQELLFELTVTDKWGQTDSAQVKITVRKINQTPTALAGADRTSVSPGDKVTLDGSGSSDSDGTIAAYTWTQTDTTGKTVTLSNPSAIKPTFTAPEVTETITLIFKLTITDDRGATASNTVQIITKKPSGSSGGGCFIQAIQ